MHLVRALPLFLVALLVACGGGSTAGSGGPDNPDASDAGLDDAELDDAQTDATSEDNNGVEDAALDVQTDSTDGRDAETDVQTADVIDEQELPQCQGGPFGVGETQRALAYGADPRQILDLYLPQRPENIPAPLFVWIHGGGWQGGSLGGVPPAILALRARGMAVASLEYRLSDTPFPTTISDVRDAIRWLRDNAEALGVDPGHFVAGGSSAGGHLTAMLAVASDVQALDLQSSAVSPALQAAVVIFGPSDLLNMDGDTEANGCPAEALCHDCVGSPESKLVDCEAELSTCAETANLASPTTHVTSDDPPTLVLHGTADCTVATPQGRRLYDALSEAGVATELVEVDGAGHSVGEVLDAESLAAIDGWLDRHIFGCTSPEPAPSPLAACLTESCPELAQACQVDPVCLEIETCLRACLGEAGCVASCTQSEAPASVGTHRAMFTCGDSAGCYP